MSGAGASEANRIINQFIWIGYQDIKRVMETPQSFITMMIEAEDQVMTESMVWSPPTLMEQGVKVNRNLKKETRCI